MEKHTAYYNLLDQLKDPACPVCALAGRAVKALLERYLEEGVVHEDTWDRLKAAGGWCGRHARGLEAQADGLAVSLFYGHLLEQEAAKLEQGQAMQGPPSEGAAAKGWLAGLGSPPPPCPACELEAGTVRTQSRLLALGLGEDECWKALEAHPGLCLAHVRSVLAEKPARGADFARQQAGRLRALAAELELFVRRSEHGATEAMGAEADAWRRALRRYYGLRTA